MKLRIRGNSIRLRLLQKEVSQIGAGETVSETINFGASKLEYALKSEPGASEISAHFNENKILITLPENLAKDWAQSNKVTLETAQKISGDDVLKILIEKDFVCVERPDDADNKDAFPHPPRNC